MGEIRASRPASGETVRSGSRFGDCTWLGGTRPDRWCRLCLHELSLQLGRSLCAGVCVARE